MLNIVVEDRSGINSKTAWGTLKTLFNVGGHVLEIVGSLSFLFRLSTSNSEGPIFAVLCLAKPILTIMFRPGLWDTRVYIFLFCFNPS